VRCLVTFFCSIPRIKRLSRYGNPEEEEEEEEEEGVLGGCVAVVWVNQFFPGAKLNMAVETLEVSRFLPPRCLLVVQEPASSSFKFAYCRSDRKRLVNQIH